MTCEQTYSHRERRRPLSSAPPPRQRASGRHLSFGAHPFSAGLPGASHRSVRPSRACAFGLSGSGGVGSVGSGGGAATRGKAEASALPGRARVGWPGEPRGGGRRAPLPRRGASSRSPAEQGLSGWRRCGAPELPAGAPARPGRGAKCPN